MTKYIALLRGINVGGNNIILMEQLRKLCEDLGFKNVKTYIQSGNVIFESDFSEQVTRDKLEEVLLDKVEAYIIVVIRNVQDLKKIAENNPFQSAEQKFVGVLLFNEVIDKSFVDNTKNRDLEEIIVGKREVYIHYPKGMGKSKLKLPNEMEGTMRNMNTLNKLVELSE